MKMKAPTRKDRIHSPPGYSAIKPLNKYTSAKSPARVKISTFRRMINASVEKDAFDVVRIKNKFTGTKARRIVDITVTLESKSTTT
jgi:hypothetical protein